MRVMSTFVSFKRHIIGFVRSICMCLHQAFPAAKCREKSVVHLKCACLRTGGSAKTLRRISAGINLITAQELSHAINMFGTFLIEKDAKIDLA